MSFIGTSRSLLNRALRPLGLEVRKINPSTMALALMRIPERGLQVNSIIDIGASDGNWTQLALRAMPTAKVVMVDALAEREKELDALCATAPGNLFKHIAAAGDKIGELEFLVTDDLNGSGGLQIFLAGSVSSQTRHARQ